MSRTKILKYLCKRCPSGCQHKFHFQIQIQPSHSVQHNYHTHGRNWPVHAVKINIYNRHPPCCLYQCQQNFFPVFWIIALLSLQGICFFAYAGDTPSMYYVLKWAIYFLSFWGSVHWCLRTIRLTSHGPPNQRQLDSGGNISMYFYDFRNTSITILVFRSKTHFFVTALDWLDLPPSLRAAGLFR